ncbi:diguanylate cyclase domain-containing protein [Butyrivibrio sp. MB2005]|uniref:diguanylate cyclase domain-containing protein n=1 Tax=Butyrivibrio sp. MB2005 TaxID=1280678 RepID=UPI00040F43B7|nr:diguanylate cyclase [Butyrivibrio sp. MB2005]
MDKRRILVVDDDEIIIRLTKGILSDKYDIVTADSGQRAIDIYADVKPDMILSDLIMPGMTGFEMMENLRAKYNIIIPVMFMTALSSDETEEQSLTIGAVDYIRKPFKADVLLHRVDNIMANLDQIRGLRAAAENDTMTGLLNKTTSMREIDQAVRNGQGILMMIDLDSFKLVNDIYGHEKGDQILIRFAEILKSIMRSSDIIGRVGGDEFIAFCQNTKEERMLRERTEFLNRKLFNFAKECLAEDMNIPLGCSIGAAICPDEGNDFNTLFKKADEALYEAKHNGKHGYVIYKHGEDEVNENKPDNNSEIRMILGEREGQRGAYVLPMDQLKTVYRFLIRVEKNYPSDIHFIVFTLESRNGHVSEYRDKYMEVMASCLRGSDIVAKYGDDKVIAILLKASAEDYHVPLERVMMKWNEMHESLEVEISYTVENLMT